MPRTAADRWARGSTFAGALYHATYESAAFHIRREGFDLARRSLGRAWGNGVYCSPDPQVAAYYARVYGSAATILELRVRIRSMLHLEPLFSDRLDLIRQALVLIPGAYPRFVELSIELSRILPSALVSAEAFSKVLVETGYDALEVVEVGISSLIGGTQIVVYDPRRIVVIG
jgi:hypothetical protein